MLRALQGKENINRINQLMNSKQEIAIIWIEIDNRIIRIN
jgi:hypothetical protein